MTNDLQTSSSRRGNGSDQARSGEPPQPAVLPPVDIHEDDHGITLLADLPGVSREQLGVRVDGDTLTIEATAHPIGAPDSMELVYSEVQLASYRRQFTLSRELDPSRIEAALKDGVLRLSIPKSEDARPRRIEVRAA